MVFVFAYFDYGPILTVEVNNELTLNNNLALKYKIKNESYFPIRNINVVSRMIKINTGDFKILDYNEFKHIDKIDGNDYKDIIFKSLVLGGNKINEGLIEIIAVYKFSLFNDIPILDKPYTYKKQFKAIKDKNGETYWLAF